VNALQILLIAVGMVSWILVSAIVADRCLFRRAPWTTGLPLVVPWLWALAETLQASTPDGRIYGIGVSFIAAALTSWFLVHNLTPAATSSPQEPPA
jgi:hypothetical protein